MVYAPLESLEAGDYDAEKDFVKLEGEGEYLRLPAGRFVIMAPQDAHMPGMTLEASTAVKKVVVKVRV